MNIQTIQDDILQNPKGEALMIFKFANENGNNNLFNKIDRKLNFALSNRIKKFGINIEKDEHVEMHNLSNMIGYEAVYAISLGEKKDSTVNKFQDLLSRLLQSASQDQYKSCALLLDQFDFINSRQLGKIVSEALYLSQYKFLKYKTDREKQQKKKIENLYLYTASKKLKSNSRETEAGIIEGKKISDGVILARDLVNEPAIYATPKLLSDKAIEIANASGTKITAKILDKKECEKLKMGAFLAITKGSVVEPKFIILHYKPKKPQGKICLVGKAVTFDSGGLSLKPSSSMDTMKLDMAGGAVVLGLFEALSSIEGVDYEIWGVIPACENMPDGGAIRPGDVVKAMSGKTIEILNTDAEGRMILADAITYAQNEFKPDVIIDLATLTGAVMVALGADIAGILSNDDDLALQIKQASERVGELAWILPLHKPYKKNLKSQIADIANVSSVRYGGTINGALFIEEFVTVDKWAHIDIAGVSYNEKKAQPMTPRGGTGWGVRTLLEYLLTFSFEKKVK